MPCRSSSVVFAVILSVLSRACQTRVRAATTAAQTGNPVTWTAWGLDHIGQNDAPGSGRSVSLLAARGEYESFQVGIRADGGPLSGISVAISNFTAPGGAVIPAASTTIYREHYIQVRHSSPDRGGANRPLGPGTYADALVPIFENGHTLLGGRVVGAPFDVSANQNQPVWVDVLVPRDAQPGTYSATLNVTSDQGRAAIPVSLKVWRFALPEKPALKTSFGLHGSLTHDVNAQQVLLNHRISPTLVDASRARSLRAAGLSAAALPFTSNASRQRCTMEPPPASSVIVGAYSGFPPDLPVYVYVADEIDPCPNLQPTVLRWAKAVHQASPAIKTLATMTPTAALFDDGSGSGRSAVDIWVVLPAMYEANPDAIRRALNKGDEVWSYNAMIEDGFSPKWALDYPSINYRIQPGFLSQQMQLTGLLYWSVDKFSSSSWEDVEAFRIGGYFFPGEGVLLYQCPDANKPGVLPSIRLKHLRDGVDDYDYINILKRMGQQDWAFSTAAPAGTNWKNWTRDPGVLYAIRQALGEKIDRLAGAGFGESRTSAQVDTPRISSAKKSKNKNKRK